MTNKDKNNQDSEDKTSEDKTSEDKVSENKSKEILKDKSEEVSEKEENKKNQNQETVVESKELKQDVTEIKTGMIVRVHQEIKESDAKGKEKTRIQIFEGIVISTHRGMSPEATFTVRKTATGGVGVEKIFPLYLPSIKKIEVIKKHKIRRAKLYYLRGKYKKKLKEIKDKIKK